MTTHGVYILASYAFAAVVVGGMAVAIVVRHRALLRALAALPARDDEAPR
jgi:heme exporter protein CcmD